MNSVLRMFLPSFITGSLILRFGVLRVMLSEVLFFVGHIFFSLSRTGFAAFVAALICLGVGWNFMFIGGTALLTSTYSEKEKGKAQAINDMSIFIIGLASSLAAGGLLDAFGWQKMNLLLLPWLIFAAGSLVWHGARNRKLRFDPVQSTPGSEQISNQ